MSATFTWGIKFLERTVDDGVVHKVRWTLVGEEGEYKEECDGAFFLPEPSDDGSFIPYEDLNEDIILNWLFNDPNWRGTERTEAFIQSQIDKQKVQQEQDLPWKVDEPAETPES